jgi:hypothetical protein
VVVATAGAVGTQLWEAEGTDLAAEAAEASAEVGASAAVDSVAEVASGEAVASVEVAAGSGVADPADSVAAAFEGVDFAVDLAEGFTVADSMGSDFMIRSFLVTTDMDTAIPITIHMPTIRTATRLTGMDITGPQLEL